MGKKYEKSDIDLDLLRQLREVEGLSHKEIAIRLNKTEKAISHYCSKHNIRKIPKCANKNTCKYCGKEIYYLRDYCNRECFTKHKSIKANERYALETNDIIEKYSNGISMKNIAKEKKIDKKIIKSILENSNVSFEKEPKINIGTVNDFLAENFKDLLAIDLKREIRNGSNYKHWIDIQCNSCGQNFNIDWANLKRKNKDGSFRFKGCYNCGDRKNKIDRHAQCNCCGKEIEKKNAISKGTNDKGEGIRYYCSNRCLEEKENTCCIICNKRFIPKNTLQNVCSDKCKEDRYTKRLEQQILINEANFKSETKICKNCGEEFETEYKGLRDFCSERCRKRKDKERDKVRARRMKENGDIDTDITLDKVYKKYNGECQICKRKCNYNDFGENINGYNIYGNSYPSIDHIVPISKGGTHTWGNVQLACRICNSYKSDSYVEEREGQLRLF